MSLADGAGPSAAGREVVQLCPNLPPPPYPARLNNKPNKTGGYAFELNVERMRQSDTWALAEASQRGFLFLIWIESWTQEPAGSLPDSEEVIAKRIGLPLDEFRANKDVLMRGWWKASDGRLYHPVIAELVVGVMERKTKNAARQRGFRERQLDFREKGLRAGVISEFPGEVTRYSGGTTSEVTAESGISHSPTTATTTTIFNQEQDHLPESFRSRGHDAANANSAVNPVCIPLKGGGVYRVTEVDIVAWTAAYPGQDVISELRKAAAWCEANPAKRKTLAGVRKFSTGWLARNHNPRPAQSVAYTGFADHDYQKDADAWNS